ncbi:hypothetical protein UT300013_01580 [Paraclostridium sordellii]
MKYIKSFLEFFKSLSFITKVATIIGIIAFIIAMSSYKVNKDTVEKNKIIYDQQMKEKEQKEYDNIKKEAQECKKKRNLEIENLKSKNKNLQELENKSNLFKDTFFAVNVDYDTFYSVKEKLKSKEYSFTEDKSKLDSDGFSRIEVKSKENDDKVVIIFAINTIGKKSIEQFTTYTYYRAGTNKAISVDNAMFTSNAKYNLIYNEKPYSRDVGYDSVLQFLFGDYKLDPELIGDAFKGSKEYIVDISVDVVEENTGLLVYLESNLPDGVEVTVRIKNDELGYSSADTRDIKYGKAVFGQYPKGNRLFTTEKYDLIVEVDRVDYQSNELRKEFSRWVSPGLNEYGDIKYNIKSITF